MEGEIGGKTNEKSVGENDGETSRWASTPLCIFGEDGVPACCIDRQATSWPHAAHGIAADCTYLNEVLITSCGRYPRQNIQTSPSELQYCTLHGDAALPTSC